MVQLGSPPRTVPDASTAPRLGFNRVADADRELEIGRAIRAVIEERGRRRARPTARGPTRDVALQAGVTRPSDTDDDGLVDEH